MGFESLAALDGIPESKRVQKVQKVQRVQRVVVGAFRRQYNPPVGGCD
jgi:hypothetical protein